jgi:hypothetical protein
VVAGFDLQEQRGRPAITGVRQQGTVGSSGDRALEDATELLLQARGLAVAERETNVFSVGGRGYYENPASDLLRFFLTPTEVHGFGDLVLRSLLECTGARDDLADEKPLDIGHITDVKREEWVKGGKGRIDMLVVGSDGVLVVENKLHHVLANPLSDYVEHVNDNDEYQKAPRRCFVVLGLRREVVEPPWVPVTYRDLIARIESNLGGYLTGAAPKWIVLFREFLLNLKEHIVDMPERDKRAEFYRSHFKAIEDLTKMKDDYIEAMKERVTERLDEICGGSAIDFASLTWSPFLVLRVSAKVWVRPWGNSYIAILLHPEGYFHVNYYVAMEKPEDEPTIRAVLLSDGYRTGPESNKRILGFYGDGRTFSDVEGVLDFVAQVAGKFQQYFASIPVTPTRPQA